MLVVSIYQKSIDTTTILNYLVFLLHYSFDINYYNVIDNKYPKNEENKIDKNSHSI